MKRRILSYLRIRRSMAGSLSAIAFIFFSKDATDGLEEAHDLAHWKSLGGSSQPQGILSIQVREYITVDCTEWALVGGACHGILRHHPDDLGHGII